MARYARLAYDSGARIIGGCCGTSFEHVASMRKALDEQEAANALAELPALLKKVALQEFSRETVAGLSGSAWIRFLDASLPGCPFQEGPGDLLVALSYADSARLAALEPGNLFQLLDLSEAWLALPTRVAHD